MVGVDILNGHILKENKFYIEKSIFFTCLSKKKKKNLPMFLNLKNYNSKFLMKRSSNFQGMSLKN